MVSNSPSYWPSALSEWIYVVTMTNEKNNILIHCKYHDALLKCPVNKLVDRCRSFLTLEIRTILSIPVTLKYKFRVLFFHFVYESFTNSLKYLSSYFYYLITSILYWIISSVSIEHSFYLFVFEIIKVFIFYFCKNWDKPDTPIRNMTKYILITVGHAYHCPRVEHTFLRQKMN